MGVVADAVSWVLLLAGAFFCLVGGVGLLRLPDFYSRLHAGGITDTMGATLVLLGLLPRVDSWLTAVKLAFLLIFLLLTSPISSHAVARSAHAKGLVPWRRPERGVAGGEDRG